MGNPLNYYPAILLSCYSGWFTFFMLSLSFGALIYPQVMSTKKDVTNTLPRTVAYTGFFLAFIYFMVSGKTVYDILFIVIALLLGLLWNKTTVVKLLSLIITGLFIGILTLENISKPGIIELFISSLISGWTLGTMLLGHSYLASKLMSFDVLINNSKLLFFLILLNIVYSLLTIHSNKPLGTMIDQADLAIVFIILRGLTGFILAPILTFMAFKCAKIKSNQSATGILYSTCLVVIISEMTNQYLYFANAVSI